MVVVVFARNEVVVVVVMLCALKWKLPDALHYTDVIQSTRSVVSRANDPGDISTLCCLADVMRKSADPVGSLSLLRPISVQVREMSSPRQSSGNETPFGCSLVTAFFVSFLFAQDSVMNGWS